MLESPHSLEVFLVNRGRNQAIVEGIQKQYLDALAPILADVISPCMEVSLFIFSVFLCLDTRQALSHFLEAGNQEMVMNTNVYLGPLWQRPKHPFIAVEVSQNGRILRQKRHSRSGPQEEKISIGNFKIIQQKNGSKVSSPLTKPIKLLISSFPSLD